MKEKAEIESKTCFLQCLCVVCISGPSMAGTGFFPFPLLPSWVKSTTTLGRPLPRELGPPVGATVAGFTSPSEPSLEEGSMLESMAPMARTERACPLAKASPLWEPPHEG